MRSRSSTRSAGRGMAGVALAAVLVAAPWGAPVAPEYPESLPVITWEYDQLHAEIAYSPPSNRFLAVWEDHHWGWGADWDIYGRFLSTSASGAGEAFGIAWADAKHRVAPDVAHNSAINQFLVVFELEYSAADHDIYARRVLTDGSLGTIELPVATETAYDSNPAIAYNPEMNEYLVVFERMDPLGRHDIYGRRLKSDGTPNGNAFAIYVPGPTGADGANAPATPYDAIAPDVAYSPIRHTYLVVWQDKLPPATTFDIRGRIVGATGFLDGADFAISAWEYDQLRPRVAHNTSSDEFLVVWEDHHWAWGADSDIYAQRVRADGAPMGGKYGIAWDGVGRRLAPDLAYDALSGDFLVTWEYERTQTDHDIYQRRMRADGTLPSTETIVSTLPANQTRPVIASTSLRSFVIVWQDERDAGKGVNLYADPVYLAQPVLDLKVGHVELTQAIQCKDNARCADNAVPLISGKKTFARVYVKVEGSAAADTANVTAVATAREANGAVAQGKLLNGPIVARLSPDRANEHDTLNFAFEAAALDQIGALEVTINPAGAVAEDNLANNTRVVPLNFQAVPDLHLVGVRIKYLKDGEWYTVAPMMPFYMTPYLRNVLPIGKVTWSFLAAPVECSTPMATLADWSALLGMLRDMKKKDTLHPADAHWYAMLPFSQVDGPAGLGSLNGYDAMGRVPLYHENLEDAADILAHELGHNWGRLHAPGCLPSGDAWTDLSYPYPPALIGDVGWDPQQAHGGKATAPSPGYTVPSWTWDLMSYCQDEWVSEYTYRGILNYRGSWPAGAWADARPKPVEPASADEPRAYVFASGAVASGTATLDPFTVLTRTTGFSDHAGAGPYRLRVVAANSELLFERRFDLAPVVPTWLTDTLGAPDAASGWFYEIVPWAANAARVEMWSETGKLAERSLSPSAPVVQVTAPSAGAVWSADGTYAIQWTASDADGDALTFDVSFSKDGGVTWQVIATRLRGNRLDVGADALAGTSQARIRVYASDGLRTRESASGAFTIEKKRPQAVIAAPESGGAFPVGRLVELAGAGHDAEDGPLTGARLAWSSSRDGALGTGESLTVNVSRGVHEITLRATDSDGGVGIATATISVGPVVRLPLIRR